MPLRERRQRQQEISVSVKQKQRTGTTLLEKYATEAHQTVPYYERRIFGLRGGIAKQRTLFFPKSNRLIVEITQKGKPIGHLRADINRFHGVPEAVIGWKEVDAIFRKKGLAMQMIAESMHVMKKAGVKYVRAQVIGGISIYRTLGFKEAHHFGETWVWKEL